MRKLLIAAAAACAAIALASTPASATTVYYETVGPNDVTFIPACVPGPSNPTCDPRGAGSVFISVGTLSYTQGGSPVGSINTKCTTTHKVGNDYYGLCEETLHRPGGDITAVGEINESGLERYEPQHLSIAGPPGGTLTVLQVVYPNVFKLTVN
ncbi:MAG: hypothetical protein HOV83_28705 [Catenulispora sp.]|nr:hypothetical protein [Catenulispora sp.]